MPADAPQLDVLAQLQAWYAAQCDGDWEHQQGVHIETIDNPGWWVKVDLSGTDLEGMAFDPVISNVNAEEFAESDDWYSCKLDGTTWHGAGDPSKLQHILRVFLTWAAANEQREREETR